MVKDEIKITKQTFYLQINLTLQYCVNISIKNVKDHPLVKIKLREKMYLHFAATKLVSLKNHRI